MDYGIEHSHSTSSMPFGFGKFCTISTGANTIKCFSDWAETIIVLPAFEEFPDVGSSEYSASETSSSAAGEIESEHQVTTEEDDDAIELVKKLQITLDKIRKLKGRTKMPEEIKEEAYKAAYGFEECHERPQERDAGDSFKKPKWDDTKECPICHSLVVNMRRHRCSNMNEFPCAFKGCPKLFNRLDVLKRHSLLVHGVKLTGGSAYHLTK